MKSSPGLTVTTGGMSGCHRLCSLVGCSVGFFLMSTEMTVLAMLPPPLDLQMPLHHVVRQLRDFALCDDASGIENGEALGDVPHEIEPLLDEQHRALPLDQNALD